MIYNGVVQFEAGKIYEVEVETGSFQRWIKRGAEEVVELEEVKGNSKEDNKKVTPEVIPEVKPEVVPNVVEHVPVVPAKKEDNKNKKNKDKIDL